MAGAGLAWRLVGTGGAVLGGVVARKVAHSTWSLATGKQPPVNPEDPSVRLREAAAWAAVSGAIVGLARLFVVKQAAQFWKKSTGKLPPNMHKAKV